MGQSNSDEPGRSVDAAPDDAPPEQHVRIDISIASDGAECPPVESGTRVDVSVDGEMYPTARLEDGRYVAWWFTADAPEPDDPATEEWVSAPTRFLAAGTLHERWEDPAAFEALRAADLGVPQCRE